MNLLGTVDIDRRCPELPDSVADAKWHGERTKGYDNEGKVGSSPQDRSGEQAQAEAVEGGSEMKVTFFTRNSQAYFFASRIARENRNSIRFQMEDGTHITLKKDNIISIEEG